LNKSKSFDIKLVKYGFGFLEYTPHQKDSTSIDRIFI